MLAGPLATMVLADLGADVIKVEQPGNGDGTRDWGIEIAPHDSSYNYAFNRNKRSVTLDLNDAEERAKVRALAIGADVIVENFRAGTMEKFGLGYEALRKENPALVYCAISGYDRAGDEAARPGYDLVLQGETGLMSINGEAEQGPLKFGLPVVDMFTGMSAGHAILGALLQAKLAGVGRRIDIALFDGGLVASVYLGTEALLRGKSPQRWGNFHAAIVPYGVFQASDGPFVLAAGTNRHFALLCSDVLHRPELAEDARFRTDLVRVQNRAALETDLAQEFACRTRSDILADLVRAGIPGGEVDDLHAALTGPRAGTGLVAWQLHPVAGSVPVMAAPWRLDGARAPAARPPMLGEHNGDLADGALDSGWLRAGRTLA